MRRAALSFEVVTPILEDVRSGVVRGRKFSLAGLDWLNVITLAELERALTVAGFEHGQFTLLSQSSGLDPIKSFDFVERSTRLATPVLLLEQLITHKHSLLFRHLQMKSPAVHAMHQALMSAGLPIEDVAAILSPPGTRATVPHADGHPILQFQVQGHKHWSYWDVVDNELIDHAPSVRALSKVFDDYSQRRSATNTMLDPGDMLFLPRRMLHTAVSGAAFSLSLSFQLTSQWSDSAKPASCFLVDVLSNLARPR